MNNNDIYIEKDELLLKQNLSSAKGNQKSNKKEKEKINSNINCNNNNNKEKSNECNNTDINKEKNIMSKRSFLFEFDNIEVFKNKKIYRIILFFNIITILVVISLLCVYFSLKARLKSWKGKKQNVVKKFSFKKNSPPKEIWDNIIDFQLKIDYDEIKNINIFPQEEMSFLKEENERIYYKKHIKERIRPKIKDVSFELIYDLKEEKKYDLKIYNILPLIYEFLVFIRLKDGRKLGIFFNNVFYKDPFKQYTNYYAGFVYNNSFIYEYELPEFYENYKEYVQNLILFFIRKNHLIHAKKVDYSSKMLQFHK